MPTLYPTEFVELTAFINTLVWPEEYSGRALDRKDGCATQQEVANKLLLKMATKYFKVKEATKESLALDAKYGREPEHLRVQQSITRLMSFVSQFPILTTRKLHYLFLLYVFAVPRERFYTFGGFVRDLFHINEEPADLDVWMSHHCGHTNFASHCVGLLGYTAKWMDKTGALHDRPYKRRSDYARNHEGFRLVLCGFGDMLVFDIALSGTFEELGVDYKCNSLYIEMETEKVRWGGSAPVVSAASALIIPVVDPEAEFDGHVMENFYTAKLSIGVRTNIIFYEADKLYVYPFVGVNRRFGSKLCITYVSYKYIPPQMHHINQEEFASGLFLERLESKKYKETACAHTTKAQERLKEYTHALKRQEALRMPTAADLKEAISDIYNKVASPVTWGYAESVEHRKAKMLEKGYKVLEQ